MKKYLLFFIAAFSFHFANAQVTSVISSSTNISCNGGNNGMAIDSITFGVGPFSFLWSPSGITNDTATGLVAGTYTCVVTDSSDMSTSTVTVTLTEPNPLTVTASHTNISCFGGNGGVASVVVSGGSAPYTYMWSPIGGTNATANNLIAGNYTCTITDAGGCITTQTFAITQPAGLAVTQTHTSISCYGGNNGSITVVVSGGISPYTYAWAPTGGTNATATNLGIGNYTCTITDANGCVATQTCIITQPTPLSSSAWGNPTCASSCNGSANAIPSGGTPPYTYMWAPSGITNQMATNLCQGTQTCTITDARGCILTATASVYTDNISASISSITNVSCNNGNNGCLQSTSSGGTGPFTCYWSPTGGTWSTACGLIAGSYTVTVTDANGCYATAAGTVTQPLSPLSATISFVPASCSLSNGSATVTPAGGTPAYSYSWAPSGGTSATATNLAPGNYTCTITDSHACVTTKSVTVTQTNPFTSSSSSTSSCTPCSGSATVTLTGGTSPFNYVWTPNVSTSSSSGGLCDGNYSVSTTDNVGCTTTTTFTISSATLTVTASAVNSTCGNANGQATANPVGTAPYTYLWTPGNLTTATITNQPAGTYTVAVTDACTNTATTTVTISNIPGPSATISSHTNNICFGGNNACATVQASGGTFPYTYSWTPSGGNTTTACGLIAGNYTCTVTDVNGCIATASVTITETPQITIAISHTDLTCNSICNGSATGVPSGGTAPYYYWWSIVNQSTQTVNSLCAATYTLTVTDANGCNGANLVTITQPPVLSQTTSVNSGCTACAGSATVNPAGGTGPYSYSWTPNVSTTSSASNLCSGSYTVAITDANSCSLTTTFNITNTSLTISANAIPSSSCAVNGQASVTILTGTSPYTYLWLPGNQTTSSISNLPAGSYSVTVTDACGSIATATATVTQAPPFTASAASMTLNCSNIYGSGTVVASGGTAPYNYLWQPMNTTNATANNLWPGVYHIIVGDASGCFVSVYDTIYGTPTLYNYVTATQTNCAVQNGQAVVHPSGGHPPYTFLWSNNSTNDTISGLAGGYYNVTVTDAHGCTSHGNCTINSSCDNIIMGKVYNDPNLNCIYDNGDGGLYRYVSVSPGGYGQWTNSQGDYAVRVPHAGTYLVVVSTSANYNIHCPPSGYRIVVFPNVGDTSFSNDFAEDYVSPQNNPCPNLSIWMSSGTMRPGFPVTFNLNYSNIGNLTMNNCILTFNHNILLNYNSASVTPTTYSSPTATWNLGNLIAGQSGSITVQMTVDPSAPINTYLSSNANIMPVAGDCYTWNNYATDYHIVQGSFDPNEKTISSAQLDPVACTIPQTDSILTYTIQFQNTGTDTAFNIVVVDTLSQNLNPITIEPGPSSHPYEFEMNNNVMKFNFYNILLPDSNRDELNSHGWVSYRINTRPGIAVGDVINNFAGIYFDYNAPVLTNTTSDTIYSNIPLYVPVNNSEKISAYPNPFDESTTIVLPQSISGKQNEIVLTDLQGRVIRTENVSGTNSFILQRGNLEDGIYFCTMKSEGKIVGVTKIMVK